MDIREHIKQIESQLPGITLTNGRDELNYPIKYLGKLLPDELTKFYQHNHSSIRWRHKKLGTCFLRSVQSIFEGGNFDNKAFFEVDQAFFEKKKYTKSTFWKMLFHSSDIAKVDVNKPETIESFKKIYYQRPLLLFTNKLQQETKSEDELYVTIDFFIPGKEYELNVLYKGKLYPIELTFTKFLSLVCIYGACDNWFIHYVSINLREEILHLTTTLEKINKKLFKADALPEELKTIDPIHDFGRVKQLVESINKEISIDNHPHMIVDWQKRNNTTLPKEIVDYALNYGYLKYYNKNNKVNAELFKVWDIILNKPKLTEEYIRKKLLKQEKYLSPFVLPIHVDSLEMDKPESLEAFQKQRRLVKVLEHSTSLYFVAIDLEIKDKEYQLYHFERGDIYPIDLTFSQFVEGFMYLGDTLMWWTNFIKPENKVGRNYPTWDEIEKEAKGFKREMLIFKLN